MPEYVEYRGAGKVPIVKKKMFPADKGKKDPRYHVWPRKDWINPGEHVPVTRRLSNIHSQSAAIPARKKVSDAFRKARG